MSFSRVLFWVYDPTRTMLAKSRIQVGKNASDLSRESVDFEFSTKPLASIVHVGLAN